MRTSLASITILCFLFAFSAQAQTPTFTSVVNAASLVSGPIAPGMVALISGSNLGDAQGKDCAASYPAPTVCQGVSVLVNGVPAPVSSEVASQIYFQVPFEITGSTATIQVRVTSLLTGATSTSTVLSVPVATTAPGLYSATGSGSGLGYYYVSGGLNPLFSTAVQPGQTVVLFGTGFGATSPAVADGNPGPDSLASTVAAVTLTVNGKTVPVQSAALEPVDSVTHGAPGVDEVVFAVPAGLAAGTYPMAVSVGGVSSQTVQLKVAAPPVTIGNCTASTCLPPVYNTAVSDANLNAYGPGVESGSFITIKGQNLAASTRVWQNSDFVGNAYPTQIDGVTVTINGKSAFVEYVSPTQLNVLAPADTAQGLVQVVVNNIYGSDKNVAQLQQYAPAFYTFGQATVSSSAPVYVAAVHSSDGTYVVPASYYAGYTTRGAKPNEILEIYGNGFGPTNPAVPVGQIVSTIYPTDLSQLRLTIGGVPATVQFAGIVPPGDEYQLNVVVPQLPDGDQPIVAIVGGVSSQTGLFLPIKN